MLERLACYLTQCEKFVVALWSRATQLYNCPPHFWLWVSHRATKNASYVQYVTFLLTFAKLWAQTFGSPSNHYLMKLTHWPHQLPHVMVGQVVWTQAACSSLQQGGQWSAEPLWSVSVHLDWSDRACETGQNWKENCKERKRSGTLSQDWQSVCLCLTLFMKLVKTIKNTNGICFYYCH